MRPADSMHRPVKSMQVNNFTFTPLYTTANYFFLFQISYTISTSFNALSPKSELLQVYLIIVRKSSQVHIIAYLASVIRFCRLILSHIFIFCGSIYSLPFCLDHLSIHQYKTNDKSDSTT